MVGRRRWAVAVFVGVPASLLLVWLVRDRPDALECGGSSTAARDHLVEQWLSGAGPITAAGALAVLAGIVLVSRWRSEARGGPVRAGTPTRIVAGLLTIYVVACAINIRLFGTAGLLWVVALVFFWLTIPMAAAITALWLTKRPPDQRAFGATQALGWCSLLVGIVGVGVWIALPDTSPLCLG